MEEGNIAVTNKLKAYTFAESLGKIYQTYYDPNHDLNIETEARNFLNAHKVVYEPLEQDIQETKDYHSMLKKISVTEIAKILQNVETGQPQVRIKFIPKARKKNVLVLVIGRVDFDANKKNAGRKMNMTLRKIPSPEFSSLVNHGICGHLCADMNVLGLQVLLMYILVNVEYHELTTEISGYILVYFCAMTLISIQVESGSLVL